MKSALQPYFELCFSTHFTHYRPEWIAFALETVAQNRELIASDLEAKYPLTGLKDGIEERLAKTIEFDSPLLGTLLYRIRCGIFLRDPLHPALPYLAQLMTARAGMEISSRTEIGPGLVVMHGFGVCVGPHHRVGRNFTIYQGVTLEQRLSSPMDDGIVVGDDCIFFSGAKVIGDVTIGNGVTLAANAVLLTGAESHSTYAGVPAVKVGSAASA